MSDSQHRVGFIGLGSQGGPMARRIVESGHPLTIWARRPVALEPYADTAAAVASTPAALGAASDVVGICVMGDADVEDVVLRGDGVLAGMEPGGVVAIHSTIHPDTVARLAEQAASRGVGVVDAPVSGGGGAAAQGELLVMVGGDDDHVARCRPVFDTFAGEVIHLGPLGSGQIAKLVNNLVFMALVTVGLDTFELADELGMDRSALSLGAGERQRRQPSRGDPRWVRVRPLGDAGRGRKPREGRADRPRRRSREGRGRACRRRRARRAHPGDPVVEHRALRRSHGALCEAR